MDAKELKRLKRTLDQLEPGMPVEVRYDSRKGPNSAVGIYSSYNDYNLFLQIGEDPTVAVGHIDLSKIRAVKGMMQTGNYWKQQDRH